jgi:chemotaxis protein MotB
MIRDLSTSLAAANMKATVDPNNGDIVLDSSVFFESGRSAIKEEGQQLLNRFIPVYLDVLLRDKYADYLGEIIIEGHTDSTGTYENNLKLSQDRALQVALYCLNMPSLTRDQKVRLQQILTAKGRSYSDLVYNAWGQEDADASRRVEFKFSLKDSEMIDEMNRILSSQEEPIP